MKIALVVPGGVDRSGVRRVVPAVVSLVRRLTQRHEVHVFALMQEATPGQWRLEGAQIHNSGGSGMATRLWRTLAAMRREHRTGRFQIVHSIWSGVAGLNAVCAGRLLGVPTVVHYAGGELEALPKIAYGSQLSWRGRVNERLVLSAAGAVTAASRPSAERIAAHGREAQLVPLGVDLKLWPPRPAEPRAPHEPLRLIHVASLNRVKDQPTLLQAIAELAGRGVDFHLDLIGEDTLGGKIQALAQQLGLQSRVTFCGFLTQQELRPLMERAHVNLISSLHETGPLVVLEAAVAGVPTVGTHVGHVAEWSPIAALSVPPGDVHAFSDAIKRFADDDNLRLSVASEAQARAVAIDADYTAARFEAIYAGQIDHGG